MSAVSTQHMGKYVTIKIETNFQRELEKSIIILYKQAS